MNSSSSFGFDFGKKGVLSLSLSPICVYMKHWRCFIPDNIGHNVLTKKKNEPHTNVQRTTKKKNCRLHERNLNGEKKKLMKLLFIGRSPVGLCLISNFSFHLSSSFVPRIFIYCTVDVVTFQIVSSYFFSFNSIFDCLFCCRNSDLIEGTSATISILETNVV